MSKSKIFITLVLYLLCTLGSEAQNSSTWKSVEANKSGTLGLNYFENYPFSFTDSSKSGDVLKGIDIDILKEFTVWLFQIKNVELQYKYQKFEDFEEFYSATANADNGIIGLGSVTINKSRKKELLFSHAYLKNISVLVSSHELNSLENHKDFKQVFEGRTAVLVRGSSHEKQILDFKSKYYPKLKLKYVESPEALLELVSSSKMYFGYVDLITYWSFSKTHGGVLRAHRKADINGEEFGFIMPLNSDWLSVFNEFLIGESGFIYSAGYHKILDKYLDIHVINEVQLK